MKCAAARRTAHTPCARSNRMAASAVYIPAAPRKRASASSAALRSLAVMTWWSPRWWWVQCFLND